jgi:hypothetical protein
MAYPGEAQEMVLDAFVRALTFYGGVPRRVIIDNPKTMVTYVSRSKDRVFHPRFLALMNHYVMEPVACTPASGWEKGQVENQVQFLRRQLFTPKLAFDDLESLNAWLYLQCDALGSRRHPNVRMIRVMPFLLRKRLICAPWVVPLMAMSRKPCGCDPPAWFNTTATITRQVIASNHQEGATAFRPVLQGIMSHCGPMPVVLWWLPVGM